MTIRGKAAILMTIWGVMVGGLWAAEVGVGDPMPELTLPDQHDKATEVDARVVIMAFDMGVSKSFNKWLDARGKDWLPKRNAVYVADISGMPKTISKMFAVPKMRKYSHKILLNRDDNFAKSYPRKKDMATILRINRMGEITSVSHIASPAALEDTLK